MAKRQALKYSHRASWLFGKPVLRYQNNGMAGWCRENSLSQWQKGGGWTANLYGGNQATSTAGTHWAAIFIPVNEMPISEFSEAQWSYYMTNAEVAGVNLVVWVHDYEDFTKRAEITQIAGASGLGKASGWNSHIFNTATTQMIFYGENTAGTNLSAGTQYTWAQFQADNLFKNWSIYRISLEYGWIASTTLDDAWVAEVNLNGISVPLKPSAGDHVGGEVKTLTQLTTGTSTTGFSMISPAAAKRVRIISCTVSNISNTGSEVQAYFGTGGNIDATVTKAIHSAWCDTDFCSTDSISWPDGAGPLGGIDEDVYISTSVNISSSGRVTIAYREE